MVVIDGVEELANLINTNWISSNTSSKKPNIGKITDFPFDLQMGDEKGYILLYSIQESEEIPGIGLTTNANVSETIKIDIRYGGLGDKPVSDIELLFNEYKAELKRILYSNRINPTVNYCVLNTDNKTIQNMSNRMKKFFREVREVTIEKNNRDMTI